ncbi:MAG TPA: hypothetical protein VMH91_03210 [Candidatus Paceibacterota bacterium]|nr:hypothetical protein [Candidatus Paceibacterota bacterium]
MKESPERPRSTSPEYIELVKTNIRDHGNVIEFEFHFAGAVSRRELDGFWNEHGSAVSTTIWNRLKQKGWVNDQTSQGELDAITTVTRPDPDNKVWTFVYSRQDPGTTPVSN